MRRRLRRFAAVGLLLTIVDVGLVLVLRLGVGLPVIVADAIAIAVAGGLSFGVNKLVTFADDPRIRWVHQPGAFVLITVTGLLLIVSVVAPSIGSAIRQWRHTRRVRRSFTESSS